MIEVFTGLITSAFGGGATGLLGMLLQRWFDAKKAAQEIELTKLQLIAAERTRKMELEAQERMATKAADTEALKAQLDAQARADEAAARNYDTSQTQGDTIRYSVAGAQEKSRAVRWMMAVVDFVRGLMRPAITLYTLALLSAVFVWVRGMYLQMGMTMTAAQAFDLAMQVVGTVFYLATTTVVWWFGVRPAQPPKA